MTSKHDTISAAEAREMFQAFQAKASEQELPQILKEIMAKIRSEAAIGKSAVSFSLDKVCTGRAPSPVLPGAIIDGIIESLNSQGYRVGADRRKHSIMVGWGPSTDRNINRPRHGMKRDIKDYFG